MKAALFAPAYNTPNRKDASGAFQPEARKFIAANKLAAMLSLFDSNRALPDRRAEVSRVLARQTDVQVFGFFCHGWRDGIQAGFRSRDVQTLADLMVLGGTHYCTVVLYACDAARDADADRDDDTQPGPGGEGGFADLVAQAMSSRGWQGRLLAHSTPGHTTTNPNVRVWSPGASERGAWLVEPRSKLWGPWRRALLSDLRFRYPFLSRSEIEAELGREASNEHGNEDKAIPAKGAA